MSKILFTLIFSLLILPSLAFAQESKTNSKTEKEVKQLNEIVITADPFNPSLIDNASPVTVVDKEQLRAHGDGTIGEALSHEVGVSSSYFGPGASRPIIRGNGGERVKILNNGISTLDVSSTSEDHQVTANPLTADRIEIHRGPETLLFGSQAIAGVVNVIDNKIPESGVGRELTGDIQFRTSTADNESTTALAIEGQKNDYNWHLDAYSLDTEDIDIPGNAESDRLLELEGEEADPDANGTLENSFSRSSGLSFGNSFVKDWGFIGFGVTTTRSSYGVPGHGHEEEGEEEEGHEEEEEEEEEGPVTIGLEQVRVDIRGRVDNPFDNIKSLKFNLAGSNYDHTENEGAEIGTRFSNDAFEGRVELAHDEINNSLGSWNGTFGTQVEFANFAAIGEEAFIPQNDRSAFALFAFEENKINDKLRVQLGSRVEHVLLDPNDIASDSFTPFGFSAGLVLDPNGHSDYKVGLTASYTQRAPSAAELYADGPHVARSIFEVGDPDLDTENVFGLDFTLKKNTGLFTGTLNLFLQNYNDFINLSPNGTEEDGLPAFDYNQVNARLYGVELDYAIHLHELFGMLSNELDFYGQFDMVRGENRTFDDDLPRITPVRTKVGLRYSWRDRFLARVEAQFVAAQNRVAEFELPTDSYTLLNVFLEQKLPSIEAFENDVDLSLFVRGTNLTDDEARVHTSFIKDIAPLRGANFQFGVQASF